MKLSTALTNSKKAVKSNLPEILVGVSISGLVTTSYLAGKASIEASDMVRQHEGVHGTAGDKKERLKERAKLVWKCYIPTGVSGLITTACIVASAKASANQTSAAVAAYSLTERAFSEYREKVVDELGEGKEQKLRDGLAQEHVTSVPHTSKEVIIAGSGNVLCCELFTHRYFRSDMESLRRAENRINAKINNELYVTLDEFYDLLGLPNTSQSNMLGWDSDKLMELEFSTVISEEGEPCLAFKYNYTKPL